MKNFWQFKIKLGRMMETLLNSHIRFLFGLSKENSLTENGL